MHSIHLNELPRDWATCTHWSNWFIKQNNWEKVTSTTMRTTTIPPPIKISFRFPQVFEIGHEFQIEGKISQLPWYVIFNMLNLLSLIDRLAMRFMLTALITDCYQLSIVSVDERCQLFDIYLLIPPACLPSVKEEKRTAGPATEWRGQWQEAVDSQHLQRDQSQPECQKGGRHPHDNWLHEMATQSWEQTNQLRRGFAGGGPVLHGADPPLRQSLPHAFQRHHARWKNRNSRREVHFP